MPQVHLNRADLKAIQSVMDTHNLDECTIRVTYEDSVSYLLAIDFVKNDGHLRTVYLDTLDKTWK
jgi:hypothetical protein